MHQQTYIKHLDVVHRYMESVPYYIDKHLLYTVPELFEGYYPDEPESFSNCLDTRVYQHVLQTGKVTNYPLEITARSLHDLSIRVAATQFLSYYEPRRVVGVMGGHSLARTSPAYRQTVEVSKRLTEQGFLMISGGGPGAMEATHLGAWLAGRTEEEVDQALSIISHSPTFQDDGWLADAFRLRETFPLLKDYKSLSIPTWFYGHEPPSPFATHVAKLFDNSVREDMLLTHAYGGLIFMEGSAGTLQEIFQEAVQDHYCSLGYPSPMVFVGRRFWTEEVPVVPFMRHMMDNGRYQNLLVSLTDTTDEIVEAITTFYREGEVQKML